MTRAIIISATIAALVVLWMDGPPPPVQTVQIPYCIIDYKAAGKDIFGNVVTGWAKGYGCYAAPIRPGPNGGVEYFHKWSQTWATIPQIIIEHNQSDALDSPNHEAHVCASPYEPDLVFCAVLGGGH